jgi:enoyl-CoA hydratase
MVTDEVLTERRGGLLVVTLNRPQVRNAVDAATAHGVAAAMRELDTDPRLVLGILTGAGGSFSTGMDLKALLAGEDPMLPETGFAGLTHRPPAAPLIAAVEGYALGGGCELALACDLVVASREARFGLPEARRGMFAGSGGLLRLPERIPRAIALQHALTGEPFDAVDAHRWGLVNELTEPGGALAGALALAERILASGPLAIRAITRIVRESRDWPSADRWERQSAMLAEIMRSADAKEGPRAFVEKRAPVWRGE